MSPRKASRKKFQVKNADLRWTCTPSQLSIRSTDDVIPADLTVGQDRALRALQVGLELYAPGYNLYVSGLTGSGRTSTVKKILENLAPECALVPERAYVHNFQQPDSPRLLTFDLGRGDNFRRDINQTIRFLRENLSQIFEDEHFVQRRETLMSGFKAEEAKHLTPFEEKMTKEGFAILQVQMGNMTVPDLFPVIDSQPVPMNGLQQAETEGKITAEQKKELEEKYDTYHDELDDKLKSARKLVTTLQSELNDLAENAVRSSVEGMFQDLKEKFPNPKVQNHIDCMLNAVIEDIDLFTEEIDYQHHEDDPGRMSADDPFWRYRVNLLQTHVDENGQYQCPIIVENYPSFANLFGTIELDVSPNGATSTNFTRIKPGAILKADGGYLILSASDVLSAPHVWPMLKRVIKSGTLEIQFPEHLNLAGAIALKPEPIELSVKVILIGSTDIYYLLYEHEEDFNKLFKIRAQFDYAMDRTEENMKSFAAVIRKIVEEEQLLPFDGSALCRILEYASRVAGSKRKLSTHFSQIADLTRESDYWARKQGERKVKGLHVQQARDEQIYRNNLYEEKIHESIADGSQLLHVEGEKVGQVNGLAVLSTGDHDFGKVSRITASVGLGKDGIINIEREVNMSGATHDKGVLILAGYMRHMWGKHIPLSLSVSLAFEQLYGGIDGDSASSTEAYAILSALADLPVDQSIGVTGSINQWGEIQPIGGVNEKVEGFYCTCKILGLNGKQGVIIPKQNVDELQLNDEVYKAIRHGEFKVWAIENISEGIEILTGVHAGEADDDGNFPQKTVFGRVQDALEDLARMLNEYGNENDGDSENSDPES